MRTAFFIISRKRWLEEPRYHIYDNHKRSKSSPLRHTNYCLPYFM